MLVQFALKRIRRHWQLLVVPLLGVCLATGLFGLAPLYSRAVAELGLRYAMTTERHQRVHIRVLHSQPLDDALFDKVALTLGDLYQYKVDVASSGAVREYNQSGERQEPGWFFYSYSDLEAHTTLTAGRWPRERLPYFFPSVGGWRVDAGLEPDGRLVLRRSAADLEAVATQRMLTMRQLKVGSRIRLGPSLLDPIVRIVGVVEPNDREEAYWMADSQPLEGTFINSPDGAPIFFGSLFVSHPVMERVIAGIRDVPTVKDDLKVQPEDIESNEVYFGWYVRLSRGTVSPRAFTELYGEATRLGFVAGAPLAPVQYGWFIILDRDVVTASNMRTMAGNVLRVGEQVTGQLPDAQVITGLVSIIRIYLDAIGQVQAPVTFLTAGVLVLVLYYVLTTTSLVLDQQATEWATVSSRGGTGLQLFLIHGTTVIVQTVVGFGLGLPIAQGLLFLLRRIGPLARLAVGPRLAIAAPPETWNYVAVAALASAFALLLPAIPAVRRTIVALQQTIARPPRRPLWSRFYLDFALLALGLALLWRASRLGNLQAETLAGETTLDAMSVLAPLLILTAGALLWLRAFPLVMRLLGRLAAGQRGLALPLALWGISRNPGHYAQLVLLLLGAFGLGTMAAALAATRDIAVWETSRFDVGGAVRLELDEGTDYLATAWDRVPGVTAASPVFRGFSDRSDRPTAVQLIGIDPLTLGAVTPVGPGPVNQLADPGPAEPSGIGIPDGFVGLSLWAYHDALQADARLALVAVVTDRWGFPVVLELVGDPLAKNGWVNWRTEMPDSAGRPPWRLSVVAFASQRGEAGVIDGRVLIDDIEALLADGSRVSLESFEPDTTNWSAPVETDPLQSTSVALDGQVAHAGGRSLALGYHFVETRYRTETYYGAWAYRAEIKPVPVLVERGWADQKRYQRGDLFRIDVVLPPNIRQHRVIFQVADVLDTFPTLGSAPRTFVVGPLDRLLPALNAGATQWPLEPNEVWLGADTGEPRALLDHLEGLDSGISEVHVAFDQGEALRREPLPNAFAGILFGGFWVALTLSLVGLGFYLMLTARRRMVSLSVLRAVGWSGRDVWRLLVLEQIALAIPAVVVGVALGVELASLMRGFIPLVAGTRLVVPPADLILMIGSLTVGVVALLLLTGRWLQRRELAQTLRLGGE